MKITDGYFVIIKDMKKSASGYSDGTEGSGEYAPDRYFNELIIILNHRLLNRKSATCVNR